MQRLRIIIACMLCIVPSLYGERAKQSIYAKIAKHALMAQSDLKDLIPVAQKDDGTRKFDYAVNPVSPYRAYEIVYSMLDAHGSHNDSLAVCDEETWEDLEVFCGPKSNPKMSLFKQLDHTNTYFGKAVLQKMVAQPTNDIPTLEKRQAVVKELVHNEELLQRLDKITRSFKAAEPLLFSFWEKENALNEKMYDKHNYFSWPLLKRCNQNKYMLESRSRILDVMQPLLWGGFFPVVYMIVMSGFMQLANPYNPGNYNHASVRKLTRWEHYKDSMKEGFKTFWWGMYKEVWGEDRDKAGVSMVIIFSLINLAFVLGAITCTAVGINSIFKRAGLAKHIQAKLSGAGLAARSLEGVMQVLDGNKVICDGLELKHIKALMHKTEKLKKLCGMLTSKTFVGKPSIFSRKGHILAAYKLIKEIKDELVPAYEELGKIDAYCSIAKLYKKSHEHGVGYCFPSYVKSDTTTFDAEGFWFPSLFNNASIKRIVTNDIRMCGKDTNNPRNIMLTGPNMGGKSTILKGLVSSALLSQALFIAPAKRVVMTPFDKIQTYLNIADNTSLGISLFNANLLRAKDIIHNAKKAKKGLFIMDEPFNGTSPDEVIQGGAYVAAVFAGLRNCISIMSTHFKLLTRLEEETDGEYVNYKLNAIKHSDGSISYPYTWEKGVNDVHVAVDLMRLNGLNDKLGVELSQKFAAQNTHNA